MKRLLLGLLHLALLVSALPWEALATPSSAATMIDCAVASDAAATETQSAGEDRCVCLCFSTASSLLPAAARTSGDFDRLELSGLAIPDRENSSPSAPLRLVFHPPRPA